MHKKILAAGLAALQLLCLCACQGGEPTTATTTPPTTTAAPPTQVTTVPPQTTVAPTTETVYDHTDLSIFQMKKWHKEIPEGKLLGITADGGPFILPPSEDNYRVMQGMCTDGTYMFALLEKKKQDVNGDSRSLCRMAKVDLSTWEILAYSEPMELDHGNGMTYNTKTGEILVVHGQFYPKTISVVDPETMTVKRTFDLAYNARGITYDAATDRYAVCIGGKSDFVIYDSEFNELAYYACDDLVSGNKEFGRQSISTDGKYLYMTYTGAVVNGLNGYEIICCYDWSGNFCGVFSLRTFYEIESTIHVGGVTYASFYNEGGKFYQVVFDEVPLKAPAA